MPVPRRATPGWPAWWWIGCHGGAGTTTLARLTGVGEDLGARWPQVGPSWPVQPVVLVARASAAGVWAAVGAAEQWRSRGVPGVRLLGIAVVAASPRRPPRVVTERLRLLAGWGTTIWRVGWQETFLAVEDPLTIGTPPDVAALRDAIGLELLTHQTGTGTR